MNRRDDDLARAVSGYDESFERRLSEAIITAIADTSRIGNTMVIRTGESAAALVTVLASVRTFRDDDRGRGGSA
jgi:hypothetical protein